MTAQVSVTVPFEGLATLLFGYRLRTKADRTVWMCIPGNGKCVMDIVSMVG